MKPVTAKVSKVCSNATSEFYSNHYERSSEKELLFFAYFTADDIQWLPCSKSGHKKNSRKIDLQEFLEVFRNRNYFPETTP